MTGRFRTLILSSGVVASFCCCLGTPIRSGSIVSERPNSKQPLFAGLQVEAYDCAKRRFVVRAARGYPSRKRFGFLQTALVPTVELEDVTVERFRDDGTVEAIRVPAAVMDWMSKAVSTPRGTPLLKAERLSSRSLSPGQTTVQDFCQS